MARAWFFLVLLNSSSFSATRLSISCLTCPSSSWARRTLFSSCSRVPSLPQEAPCSSSFSCSRRRLCLSRSWMERPPSPSWSRRSLISSARFLFSRFTMSSCSRPSSPAAFSLKSSEVWLRPSSWEAATSAETSAALDCHSPRTLSKFLPLFSVMRAAASTLSYSMARSSSSLFILVLDFSALATLLVRASTSSSFSTILDCSLLRAASSSSTRPMPSVSKRDFHSWISAWALERAFRESDFLIASFSIFSLRFSRSVAIILYFANREERSLLSASARALVSSSSVVTEILPLFMLAMAASNSSIWRDRSWFSTCSLFLEDSASLRPRAISSSLVLASTMLPWSSLPLLSRSALPLTASSRSQRASRRSSSMLALSFSDFTLLPLRLSICSPRSAMVLLCMRRAARVPSWAMFSSSSSPFKRASSPSRFLLSSTWVAVLEPASSSLEAISSMSFFSMVRLFSALERFPRSTANSSSSSSSLACSSLACLAYLDPRVASSSILAARALPSLSLRAAAPWSSPLTRSKSAKASWVSFRSPSTFLLAFSTSPLTFFSLSRASSASSRACSSFPLTRDRWLHLSSAARMSSSTFWRPSAQLLFSLPSLVIMSPWCAISSFRVLIWSSLFGPVLLGLGKNTLLGGDLSLQLHHGGVGLGHGRLQLLLGGLLTLDPGIHLLQVLLHVSSLVLNPDSFVNHVLNSRASGLQGEGKLVLLGSKAIVDGLDL